MGIGAELFLRGLYDYQTAAWLLEHSLQDDPSDVYRGNDSRIAELMRGDSEFNRVLDEVIAGISSSSRTNGVFFAKRQVDFNSDDLYYSIHGCNISFIGYLQPDGSWSIYCTMADRYDYTEITTLMGEGMKATKGTIANDMATISSATGVINAYNITVEFEIRR